MLTLSHIYPSGDQRMVLVPAESRHTMKVKMATPVIATKVGCVMAAKFEIRSPKAGQFRWVLTSQGRTLATGETYSRRVWAEKAIDSLHKAAATATIDDTTKKNAKRANKRAATDTMEPGASRWGRTPAGTKPAAKKTTARKTKTAKAAPPRKRTARTS